MDKTTLIATLRDNQARFQHIVSQVSQTRMLEPEGQDQLSGKDILAHLTTWEQRLVRWLETAKRGEIPQSPEPGATWEDMHRLNAQSLAKNRQLSLQDIQAASQHSFAELITLIQTFTDEALTIPHPYAWVWQGDPKAIKQPLWQSIRRGPAYFHYQDHFYDFLVRTEPIHRFTPASSLLQRYAGTYMHRNIGQLTLSIIDNTLRMQSPKHEQALPGIIVDNTRIAFAEFGLLTFPDMDTSRFEWWGTTFTRVQ